MDTTVTILQPTTPFDFALTAAHQTYYRGISAADRFVDGIYSRLLDFDGTLVLVTVEAQSDADTPDLRVAISADAMTDETVRSSLTVVERLFGLACDLRGFYALAETDPIVAQLIGPFRGLRPPGTASVFEALVFAILGQQISGAVARMLRQEMVNTLGSAKSIDGIDYHAFPSPAIFAAAGPERLRALKLSERKAAYIHDIASRIADGTLVLEDLYGATNEEVAERMLPLRGVGRWTVEWVLARALGRTDAFPADDLALQRSLGRLVHGEPRRLTAAEAIELGERWGAYKGLVTTYLFAAIRSGLV